MRLPDPNTVNPTELVESLRMSADLMTRIDGDRDHMNTSRLTCGQVQGAFRLMLIAANQIDAGASEDAALLDRALGILHRLAMESTGWRRFFKRWYFSDEPLRNDAANLVREAQFEMPTPTGTRLVGDVAHTPPKRD